MGSAILNILPVTLVDESTHAAYPHYAHELNQKVTAMEEQSDGENIVLKGTVTEIRPKQGAHPHLKWLVSLQVNSVIAGDFTGETFNFHIHSPTKSAIVKDGQYVIHLVRNQAGEYRLESIEPWKGQQ